MTADGPPPRHLHPVEPPFDPEYDPPRNNRTPPHNNDAEMAVLGALILQPDLAPTLNLELDANDFYKPHHATIWDACHDLTTQVTGDIRTDSILLAEHLTKTGDLQRIGGASYLTQCVDACIIPSNATYYAKIVRDTARLRAVGTTGTKLQQLAYTGDLDKLDDYLGEALQTLDETVLRFGPRDPSQSITGQKDLSWLLNGQPPTQPPPVYGRRTDGHALFYEGKVNGLIGDPETAKAQPHTAEIQTPTGPRLMGDLVVGDLVLGRDGAPQKVEAVHERGHREVWEVVTSDGVTIECCDEHLWTVQDHNHRKRGNQWVTLTTAELAERGVRWADARPRWHLPQTGVADYSPSSGLPLDPYLLGLLLGDGHLGRQVRISTGDDELLQAALDLAPPGITASRYSQYDVALVARRGQPNQLLQALDALELRGTRSHTKFIPTAYLLASDEDRLALLQGLMDTDGGLVNRQAVYSTVSPHLADDVTRLVQTLGGTAAQHWRPNNLDGTPTRDACKITIRLPIGANPFRLVRKAHPYAAHDDRRPPSRTIRAIRRTGRTELMRCIAVSNPDHLYLTNGHVPTHNTWLAQIAGVEALHDGGTFAMIDVDHNGPDHTAARLALLGARLEHLADPTRFRYYEPEDGEELRAAVTELTAWSPNVLIVDSIGEVFPMLGVNTNDGDEITGALRTVCTRPAATGTCVITIDHLPKSHEARSTGFAIGSIAKKRMIRGSYLRVDAKVKPVPGGVGVIMLRIEKDTNGELRKSSGGGYAGTLTLDSTEPHVTTWTIGRDAMPTNDDGTFRPTSLMERVSRHIEENDQCSFRGIKEAVTAKDKWLRDAIQLLVVEGFVARLDGPRGSKLHHSIAAYRETEDDHVQPTN